MSCLKQFLILIITLVLAMTRSLQAGKAPRLQQFCPTKHAGTARRDQLCAILDTITPS